MKPLKLTICSKFTAADIVKSSPVKRDVISIRCPCDRDNPIDSTLSNIKDLFIVRFEDIESPSEGKVMPSRDHIEQTLAFAKGKEDLIVHCYAGVSRSSAIAFLIAYAYYGKIEVALTYLNPNLHWPNSKIIELGEEVLQVRGLVEAIAYWKDYSKELQ